ncbi:MAG: DnaJ domain-containing protein, partial [Burkholderiales bacterium]|nr:DnaJ domain-containing protein [Burkholderiales bacterium]
MATHYETLGVPETASLDDIKKAYKKLAMQYHPDQNQGSKESEAKFKEISVAYDEISTQEKREAYDRKRSGRQDNWSFNFAGGHPDLEDLLNQMFRQQGFGNFHRSPPRNRDVNLGLEITLEEAFHGKSTPLKYKTPAGRDVEVIANIPAGIESGVRVRYQGQGENSNQSAPAGDLYIQVLIKEHPIFQRQGHDLHSIIEVDAISAIVGTKHRM